MALAVTSSCHVEAPELTFDLADLHAAELRMAFAAAKEEADSRTALRLYLNPQFNTWTDEFSDPVDRVILKAMRDRLDGATHTYNEAWEYLSGAVDRLPCACGAEHDPVNRECPGKIQASADTVKRHVRKMAKHGIAEIQANNNRIREGNGGRLFSAPGRGGKQAGTDLPNTITLNMGHVLKIRNGWDEVARKRTVQTWTEPWDARTVSTKHKPKPDDDAEQTKLHPSSTPLAGVKHPSSTPIPRTLQDSNALSTSKANPGGSQQNDHEVEVSPPGNTQTQTQGAGTKDRSPAAGPDTRRQWDKNPGDKNTVTFWVSGGQGHVWTHDKPRPKRIPSDARTTVLAPDEASFMWNRWPKGRPPEQTDFLRMWPSQRARMVENADREQDARDERRKARRDQTQFSPDQIVMDGYREQLTGAGVSSDEIDQRIAGEWADLSRNQRVYQMKLWARSVQATTPTT
jgi:hypothetical protein